MKLLSLYGIWETFNHKEKVRIILLFFSFFILSILQALGLLSLLPFLLILTGPEILQENEILSEIIISFGLKSDQSALLFFALFSFGVLLISSLFSILTIYWTETFYSSYGYRISYELYKTYLVQKYLFFLYYDSSQLLKNATEEVDRYVGGVVSQIIKIVGKGMTSFLFLAIILYIDFKLTLLVFLVIGIGYLIIYFVFNRSNKIAGKAAKDSIEQRFKYLNLGLRAIKEVKLYNSESYWGNKYFNFSKSRGLLFIKHKVIGQSPPYLIGSIAYGGLLLIITFYITVNINKEIIPYLTLYIFTAYKIGPNLSQIYSALTKINFHLSSFEIIKNHLNSNFDLIDSEIKNDSKISSEIMADSENLNFNDTIELKNISFSFSNKSEKIIDNLNFSIKKNKIIGIIGNSGEGKTTLIDIICGLLTNYTGKIFLDGKEVKNLNNPNWQNKIGYVPQNVYLIDENLENNIAFSQDEEEIDLKRVKESLNLAELNKFVSDNNLKTNFGEDGIRLSGGQKKRIGIAKALYRNPEILILDEATSSLDIQAVKQINDTLKKLSKKITILIVSHQFKSLEICDEIYEMQSKRLFRLNNEERKRK